MGPWSRDHRPGSVVSVVQSTDLDTWLDGTWRIDRTINRNGHFSGTAAFSPLHGGRVQWSEHGELQLGDHRGPASRELRLVPVPGVPWWQVLFDNDQPFHPLDLSGGRWQTRHDCGDDVYLGEYVVGDRGTLIVDWHVTGPGRDDRIRSVYTRLSPEPPGLSASSGPRPT